MDNFWNEWAKPELVWFIIGLIMLLIEFALPGLIIFFFGIGAWIVALSCYFFNISLNLQLLLFILSSTFLLLTLRKWLKSVFTGRSGSPEEPAEKLEEFLGERAIVTKDIFPDSVGRVEFHGTQWNAVAGEAIPKGKHVEIIGKDNITFEVKPV
jgi:membrane protein implicated in regulation of membrane protease activity